MRTAYNCLLTLILLSANTFGVIKSSSVSELAPLDGTTTLTVSNDDLLQTNLSAVTQASEDIGSLEPEVYDGAFALGNVVTQRLTVGTGHFIQFDLDLTKSAGGYDIISITTSTHWATYGFGGRSEQRYRLLISFAGDPATFVELAPLTYYTPGDVGGRAVQVTLANDGGGVLDNGIISATGVAGVRFEFAGNSGPFVENGAIGANMYREIDIFGSPVNNGTFKITEIVHHPDDTVTLSWRSQPGRFYRVERSEGLAAWETVAARYPISGATGDSTAFTDPAPPNPRVKAYYRVVDLGPG